MSFVLLRYLLLKNVALAPCNIDASMFIFMLLNENKFQFFFFFFYDSIAECFAFLVCTKWSNPVIHRNSRTREASSSSSTIRYLDWNSGLVVSAEDDQQQDRMCGLQDLGGHIMKIPVIGFQIDRKSVV